MGGNNRQGRSPSKSKADKTDNGKMVDNDHPLELEERFAAAATRPHFRTPTTTSNKVVLDDRFATVLTDPRFQLDEKDKYGRRRSKDTKVTKGIKKKGSKPNLKDTAKDDLKSFYVVGDEAPNDDDKVDDDIKTKASSGKDDEDDDSVKSDSDSDSDSSGDTPDKKTTKGDNSNSSSTKVSGDPESRIAYLTALSRGELNDTSSSSSSSSDDDDDSSHSSDDNEDDDNDGGKGVGGGEDPVYGTAGILDPSTKQAGDEEVEVSFDPSPFLVVTNMDWENIRATDLFSIVSSFAPPGAVKKVQVYQSDFGRERMAQDKLYGPSDIWKKDQKKSRFNDEDEDHDHDDGSHSDEKERGDEEQSEDDDDDDGESEADIQIEHERVPQESDYDPEKLRAYEASKLKYYFALVEFHSVDHADIVYREVDGMEFEHSSAAIDLRTIPADEVENVVADRPLRDEATSIPGNYEPPDFIVSALQQTNVQCTWDQGDTERERKLTTYGSAVWHGMAEADDLKAYLASDASSDEEESDEEGTRKGSRMRKLLGLNDSDAEDEDDKAKSGEVHETLSDGSDEEQDESEQEEDEGMSKEMTFIPGQASLEEKIRSKLSTKGESEELTPWQKYQEKRKQKRRERRQAARGSKRSERDDEVAESAATSDALKVKSMDKKLHDDFFADINENDDASIDGEDEASHDKTSKKRIATEHQLELLLAGEHNEEQARDFNIRGIQRLEKNKDKKLTGSRKRKEAKIASDVAGTDFKVNIQDDRFKAVLDGSDDRFGIDKTDSNYKDTSAMREILSEQTLRRKKKRQKVATSNQSTDAVNKVVPDVRVDSANANSKTSGASALSSLVQRLKSRV